MKNLRNLLTISDSRLAEINALLIDPDNEVINELLEIVEEYGGPQEINRKAEEAGKLENLMAGLKKAGSSYLADLDWLKNQKNRGSFISMDDYYKRVLGQRAESTRINQHNAVTLEISALQYFPWLIKEARRSIEKKELMPGRYIRVRNMAEQETDNGDLMATAAAMQIIGATYVETLDTRGTDGSNVHLGGPETITGYFGGVGQPNEYPIKWVKEYLKFYTRYGVRQVLNINAGTVLVGYLLHKLGVNNEFKISVYMGNDNPFSILWTLTTARLFARADGSTSLIGFNLSNSVSNETIRRAAAIRRALGLENVVRFEHHITETWKSIVRQPYNRRSELVEVARDVPNISAKHEGGEVDVEKELEHPSDILEYFLAKKDIEEQGLMPALERNYIEKHRSVNLTADALTKAGIGVVCAAELHKAV
jgi:hypothetical protein